MWLLFSRKVFISKNVVWPNGLSIDWLKEQLYWTDAKTNKINAINIRGGPIRTVVFGDSK